MQCKNNKFKMSMQCITDVVMHSLPPIHSEIKTPVQQFCTHGPIVLIYLKRIYLSLFFIKITVMTFGMKVIFQPTNCG